MKILLISLFSTKINTRKESLWGSLRFPFTKEYAKISITCRERRYQRKEIPFARYRPMFDSLLPRFHYQFNSGSVFAVYLHIGKCRDAD